MTQDFLNQSEDVRASYLVVLAGITTIDRQNTPEEIAFMEQMGTAANLSDNYKAQVTGAMENTQSVKMQEHLNKFKNNDLKYALVTDIINLCNADGNLNAEELEAAKKITSFVGVSDEQFEALTKYVDAANKEASQPTSTSTSGGNFLDKVGLTGIFQKLGIPTSNFINGTTVSLALAGAAYFIINNFMKSGNQQTQNTANAGGMTGFLGQALGSLMGGGSQNQGQQGQQGIAGMVSGFLSSQQGQQTLNNLLGTVMNASSQGKGLGNLFDVLGGGKNQAQGLGSILGQFLK